MDNGDADAQFDKMADQFSKAIANTKAAETKKTIKAIQQ